MSDSSSSSKDGFSFSLEIQQILIFMVDYPNTNENYNKK